MLPASGDTRVSRCASSYFNLLEGVGHERRLALQLAHRRPDARVGVRPRTTECAQRSRPDRSSLRRPLRRRNLQDNRSRRTFQRPLHYPVSDFTSRSQYLLYENGAFELRYDTFAHVYLGTYRQDEATISFWFDGHGGATGTSRETGWRSSTPSSCSSRTSRMPSTGDCSSRRFTTVWLSRLCAAISWSTVAMRWVGVSRREVG
jgi:hypothetical protein